MSVDAPPRRSILQPLLLILLVLVLPVVLIGGVRMAFRRFAPPAPETPVTRRLHQIGQALRQWADDHSGKYPPSLADLAVDQHLPPDLPLVPGTHVEFLYLVANGAEQKTANGQVVVHDPPAVNGGRGSHVLFADGSDAWIPIDELKAELERGKSHEPSEP